MNTKRFSLIACLVSLAAVCLGVYTLLAVQRQTQATNGLRQAVQDIDLNPQVPPFDLNALMRMQILQKVLDRQIIEDDYLNFIDDPQLKQDIEDYNYRTAWSNESYHSYAADAFADIFGLIDDDDKESGSRHLPAHDMLSVPQDIKKLISKTAHYAFYRDYLSLIRTDPDISALIYSQTGGSAEEKLVYIHDDGRSHIRGVAEWGEDLETFYEYFDSVDSITARLSQSLEIFPQTAPSSTKDAMRLEILQKVLDRRIVETDYLAYIDDPQLVQDIVDYNTATSGYSVFLTDYVTGALSALCDICNENGETLSFDGIITPEERLLIPQELWLAISSTAHHGLYRNVVFLAHGDPAMATFMHSSTGGSSESWLGFISIEATFEGTTVTPIETIIDYYDLADSITARLSQF